MGRPAMPVQLHLAKGNTRGLTKAEIEARQAHEEKLRSGNTNPKQAPEVRDNEHAKKMFSRLKKLYKDIDYVEALDENAINRYCMIHAEHIELRQFRQGLIDQINAPGADIDWETRVELLDRLTKLEVRIEKKREMMIKLEDRLFLNPTARVKNVPKKAKQKAADPNADLFD
ncbi:MAG: P27 family phage terminase small subunit [Firmicutes bacterium]|nr:P27 family phage terminase small subunit [Bacillota bacterium]